MSTRTTKLNDGDWYKLVRILSFIKATIEDVANSALFLASDEARHITGAELVVDGGRIIF